MKAVCLLTYSMYVLAVSDRGGTRRDVLDSGFTSVGETTGGDGMTGAGSAGRGGVSEICVRTEAGVSGTGVGTRVGVGTSGCALLALVVLASDPGACLSPDSADSWLVLRVVGVWRFCNTSLAEDPETPKGSEPSPAEWGCPGRNGSWHRRGPSFLPR